MNVKVIHAVLVVVKIELVVMVVCVMMAMKGCIVNSKLMNVKDTSMIYMFIHKIILFLSFNIFFLDLVIMAIAMIFVLVTPVNANQNMVAKIVLWN